MAIEQFLLRKVCRIPYLFGKHAAVAGLSRYHSKQPLGFLRVPARELIMSPPADQQWPAASNAGSIERPSVVMFAVSVSVVPVPDRSCCRLGFQHSVDDFHGVHDSFVAR